MKYPKYGTQEEQIERARAGGSRIFRFKDARLVVAADERGGKYYAKGWIGGALRHSFYFSFRSAQARENYVNARYLQEKKRAANAAERKAIKAFNRAGLKASDHYAVGDVVYDCWGYEQTNIDYYQVVEVKPRSIVIRELEQNCREDGPMAMRGSCQPRRGEFKGEPILKPLDEQGRIRSRHGAFSKWDGRALSYSSYA